MMKKIALVTGGNSGIGYATAKLLKQKDYEVFISGRHAGRLKQAADELGVESLLADMTKPEDIKKLASHFLESGLDVLVNNAGIGKVTPITNISLIDWAEITNVNLLGQIILIKELLPALEIREGCITNVSSICATNGIPETSLYSATKGGLEAVTRVLATELAPRIRVNSVSPGFCETKMPRMNLTLAEYAEFKNKVEREKIPMSRFGKPEEVAHVIVAQLESTYTTGAVWVVDGGVSAV
jgi:NAD(P)-dependent dehydrogenase (short-subunit alcohol dehydrogenase family)